MPMWGRLERQEEFGCHLLDRLKEMLHKEQAVTKKNPWPFFPPLFWGPFFSPPPQLLWCSSILKAAETSSCSEPCHLLIQCHPRQYYQDSLFSGLSFPNKGYRPTFFMKTTCALGSQALLAKGWGPSLFQSFDTITISANLGYELFLVVVTFSSSLMSCAMCLQKAHPPVVVAQKLDLLLLDSVSG